MSLVGEWRMGREEGGVLGAGDGGEGFGWGMWVSEGRRGKVGSWGVRAAAGVNRNGVVGWGGGDEVGVGGGERDGRSEATGCQLIYMKTHEDQP